jgi:hypothetical protein
MARLVAVFFSLVAPASAFAQVRVEVVQNGNVTADPPEARILTVRERRPVPPQQIVVVPNPVVVHEIVQNPVVVHDVVHVYQPAEPVEPSYDDDFEELGWVTALVAIDSIDLGTLELMFEDSEVAALDGQALGNLDSLAGAWRISGGISSSAELNEWLRIPELRLSIGGGQLDGALTPMADGAINVQAQSFISLHAEIAGGIYHRIGPLVPFFLGRIGYAGYFVDVAVDSPSLGSLGSETVADGAFEAGIETGIGIEFEEHIRATVAYRGTFTGAASHGVVLGIGIGYGE